MQIIYLHACQYMLFETQIICLYSILESLLLQKNEFDVNMFDRPMIFFLTEQKWQCKNIIRHGILLITSKLGL
jgi:hypothetical protein